MKHHLSALLLFLLALVAPLHAADPTAAPLFADGEVVALVGDSITHGGRWHRYIADYYATRFPGRTVRFINGGISGDRTSGVLARLDVDILVHHPTTAVVMLGMNDVGRSSYKEGSDADAKVVAQRQQDLDSYQSNMTKLVERLRAGGVKHLVLVTPSPYDQTAKLTNEKLPGVNDALARCGVFVTGLAKQNEASLVDFNGPMTALNLERQQANPSFTLIGGDRVHPGSPGHLVMAWLFLKAQGAPAVVSRTVLDAKAHTVGEVQGAKVDGLTWQPDGVSFTLAEDALPWSIDSDAQSALAWAPIINDLDRQELVVSGLADGTYGLTIDGIEVGTWPAATLGAGVNLATIATTPQAVQAHAVQKLGEEQRTIQANLRSIPQVELKWFKPGAVDFNDAAATSKAMDDYVAKSGGLVKYNTGVAQTYRRVKPGAAGMWKRVDELTGLIHAKSQPVPHQFVLRRKAE